VVRHERPDAERRDDVRGIERAVVRGLVLEAATQRPGVVERRNALERRSDQALVGAERHVRSDRGRLDCDDPATRCQPTLGWLVPSVDCLAQLHRIAPCEPSLERVEHLLPAQGGASDFFDRNVQEEPPIATPVE